MNRLPPLLLALLLLIILPLTGCANLIKGSSELKTEGFNFTDFSGIEVNGPFDVSVAYADAYSVNITANSNLFDKMDILKQDETLKINIQTGRYFGIQKAQYIDATMKVAIKMPYLRSLALSGSAKGTCLGFNSRAGIDFKTSGASLLDIKGISAGDAHFDVSGASKVTGNITAGDNEFNVSGASTVQLEGTASNILSSVSGGSQLMLEKLIVDNADMHLSGASKSTIKLTGKLDVNLSGDSELYYYGNPVMGSTRISGGSKMVRK
jgi:hypothetical protein